MMQAWGRQRMATAGRALAIAGWLFSVLAGGANAQAPSLINFQGLLTDAEGMPVKPDGIYEVEFRLWSAPQPGQGELRWGHRYPVTVMDGRFNVVLGEATGTAIGGASSTQIEAAFSITTLYLGLTIARIPGSASDVAEKQEINPRQRLLSAPYAIRAQTAARATVANDGNPVGTVIASMLTWAEFQASHPGAAAWLPCDGRSSSGTRYRTITGQNNLPDLRGQFIRGLNAFVPGSDAGTSAGDADGLRTRGVKQGDTLKAHTHEIGTGVADSQGGVLATDPVNKGRYIHLRADQMNKLPATRSKSEGGAETRPKNVAMYYYIKVND